MTLSKATNEQSLSIDANGLSVGYSTRGSGPPLVLIHGAEGDREMFAAFGKALAADFTVIAYDQRDSGMTRDLSDTPRDYTLGDMGDDVAALIKALGYQRAHVFGTSLGGLIAQVFAVRHPGCVDRLILSSTFRAGLGLATINPMAARQMSVWRTDTARYAPEIATKFFPVDFLREHPEWIEMFRGGHRTPEQSARRASLLGAPYPIKDSEIRTKSLLVFADQDELIPNDVSRAVADILCEPQVEVIAGVGHIAAIQTPTKLAKVVIAFLSS